MSGPEQREQAEVDVLFTWHKEGQLARDTGIANPHAPNTIRAFMHSSGWLQRDLQLCLARANPRYRAEQVGSKTMTLEGIEGGYGFAKQSPLVLSVGAVKTEETKTMNALGNCQNCGEMKPCACGRLLGVVRDEPPGPDCTLVEDRDVPGQYRVEAFDADGTLELSLFSGPNALERAIAFAGGEYYHGWSDPSGLAGY